MLRMAAPALMILTILSACAPLESGTTAPLRVYATSAASPWLESVYRCAPAGTAIELTGPNEADVVLRLAEPQPLSGAAFQVGVDELLVVTHPQAAVGHLSPEQVEALFAGQISNWSEVGGADEAVQVWAYAPTADVQAFFDRVALHGRPISSMARLAVSAQDMSDSVGSTPGSVGLLPRRWKAGNTREASVVASVPVLVVTPQSPQGPLADLISCLQSRP